MGFWCKRVLYRLNGGGLSLRIGYERERREFGVVKLLFDGCSKSESIRKEYCESFIK